MRKTIFSISVVIFSAGIATTAFAATAENPISAANSEVGIGFVSQQSNYSEDIKDSTGADTENGSMPGFTIFGKDQFNLFGLHNLYGSVRYTRISGNTNYREGSVYDLQSKHVTNNVDVKLGKTFFLSGDSAVTPYLFGGYHNWYRDVPDSVASPENYSNGFIGLGAKYQYAPTKHLVLSAQGGFGEVIGAHLNANLNPLYREIGFDTPTKQGFNLASRPYYTFGVSADYRVARHFHMIADAGYTDFMYGGSKHVTYPGSGETAGYTISFNEPSSQTSNFSVGIGMAYGF